MALRTFFNLFVAIILFSCSFEQDEKINYEAEFYSIVSEFEKSSILNFDRTDIDKEIFIEQFILKLDKQKNTFLQEDFNTFRETANNQTKSNYQQLKDVVDLYYLRYEEALKTRRQYLNNFDFNYNKIEKINLKPRDSFFQNEQEKQDYQRRIVKNELINLLLEDKNNFEAKSELKKTYTNRLSSISKIRESDRFGILANNFLSMLDPHASYFSKRDLENWNLRMNLSFEGIGAILSYEEEKAKIQELMPGGPAIQSKKIKVGDKIIKVGQGEKGRLKNVIGWRLDDIVELIRGDEGTTVRLEIENDQGKEVVNLTRGTVTLENSDASSEVIEFNDRKVGYIKLPSFYSDYECLRRNLYVCKTATSDVQKLLREFNYQDIEGIVLDLRNNGGGYLHEADSLTRLFINYGPTVQVKNPSKEVEILHSWRSTKVWEKPLIVLVNKYSASASEIFAGAMQDYNRGIIIGQTTFGKGSVQRFKSTNNGQIKFTDSLYYRITGLPTQLAGVKPNLVIPSLLNDEILGEGEYENAIKPSNIDDAYFVSFTNFDSELLQNSFQERISASNYFNKIDEIKKQRESNLFLSLNIDERKLIKESDQNSTLELVNFGRALSGKKEFVNFSEYEDYVIEDEFIMDAEIDQSLKVLVELIELES
jgi:carboxyl-terminal processing protease